METTEPGWYGEPGNPDLERYWDGTQWTPPTRAAAPPPSPTQPTGAPGAAPDHAVTGWASPAPELPILPPAAVAASRSRRRQLIGGAVVTVVVAGALLYWFVLRTPMMTVRGTMDLNGARGENFSVSTADSIGDTSCAGMGGYSDIAEGTSVTITDGSDKTIALTHLEKGIYIDGVPGCMFGFQVKVPANLGFYGIQVSHRGNVQFSKTDMKSGPGVTLGQ